MIEFLIFLFLYGGTAGATFFLADQMIPPVKSNFDMGERTAGKILCAAFWPAVAPALLVYYLIGRFTK